MKNTLRLALAGGAVFAACTAHALTIDFIWHGSYMHNSPSTGLDTVLADNHTKGMSVFDLVPGSVPISGVAYDYTVGATHTTGSGYLFTGSHLANIAGTGASFSFNFTGNNTAHGMNGVIMSLTGISGVYAGYHTQVGQLSHTDNFYPGGYTAGGQFSSVPEPMSLGAIGVGVLGLIRRKLSSTR